MKVDEIRQFQGFPYEARPLVNYKRKYFPKKQDANKI